jgi:hypothetical protein
MEMRDPHKAVDYILKNAKAHAKAKAERNYLEEYRKSLKAMLMKQCLETAIGAQEREAYAHPEYKALLDGIKVADGRRRKASMGFNCGAGSD